MASTSTIIFTADDSAAAATIEPAFENLLLSVEWRATKASSWRCAFLRLLAAAFSSRWTPLLEGLLLRRKSHSELIPSKAPSQQSLGSSPRPGGEPLSMVTTDWISLHEKCKGRIRRVFLRCIRKNSQTETHNLKLWHKWSTLQSRQKKESKPEGSRQMELNLDSTLTIQAKRRHL